jgi:hypothetical protein
MNLEQIREQVRAQMRALLEQRATAQTALNAVRADTNSTAAAITTATEARDAFDNQIDALTARETELTTEIDREAAMSALANRVTPANRTGGQGGVLPGTGTDVRVGQEPRSYSRENDPSGRTFIRDVGLRFAFGAGAQESNERLDRHMAEVRVEQAQYLSRAAGTGAFAGLVVPQYLTEMYAPMARAMRPFADACNHHDLPPDGMTLNISRITTGTSAALQASENTGVSNTDIDDTLLAISVQTNAGQQTLSRQAVERGTGTEDVTVQDLFRAYSTTLDSTLINQGTTGLAASATTQTFTTPVTSLATYSQIIKAQSGVEAIMLDMASGDNIVVMHSRRWYSLQSSSSAAVPLIQQPGLNGSFGVNLQETYGSGARGRLPNGAPVIVDNNIVTNLGGGTNQDEIYVADRMECHLWEDPNAPVFIRAEQPAVASLGILFVLYGYFAYTFGRYPGMAQKVTGAALIPPAFDGT